MRHTHHTHAHNRGVMKSKMIFSIGLNFIIMLAEIIGGILSGSLALLSEAFHNFSDAMSLLLSYIAIRIGERKENEKYTFGYKRAETLTAFVNSTVLVGVSLFLFVEAYKRFRHPNSIDTGLMLIVAVIS